MCKMYAELRAQDAEYDEKMKQQMKDKSIQDQAAKEEKKKKPLIQELD